VDGTGVAAAGSVSPVWGSVRECGRHQGEPPFSLHAINHMLLSQIPESPSEAPRFPGVPSQPEPMTDNISLPASNLAFVSPLELARLLRVTTDSVYRLVARRSLPVYRVLRRILFRRTDVERWLEAHKTDPRDHDLWR
jgi:excisionase family DNA binding protein